MTKRFFLMVLTIVVSIMQLDAQQTETNMKYRYIASCVFTRDYPELSLRIQDYLKERFGMEIIRCCAEKYKVRQFEEVMAPSVCEQWKATPHYIPFEPNTTMISICHNCTAVFQESHPDINVLSLWEFILQHDADFHYPDYGCERMTIQDCWRQYDNQAEQAAVRELLRRMNIEVVEMAETLTIFLLLLATVLFRYI